MRNERRLLGWLCVSFMVLGACSEPAAPKREEALASTTGALAAPPQVVRDINTESARHFQPIAPTAMAALGDLMFFTAGGSGGYELWLSDGTVAGTRLVRDIHPGEESSSPEKLTPMGGHVYFLANDGRTGKELWRSDGTPEGTVLVKDIYPGSESSFATQLTPLGDGVLLFAANDGVHGAELWRTDGTEAGTVIVKEISAGSFSSGPLYLTEVRDLGLVFFSADDDTTGRELWRTDGTEEGTFRVQDLVPGRGSSDAWNFKAVGSSLFFRARTADHGDELWRTDGTPNSITLVKDLVPGTGSSTVKEQVALGDILYFTRVGQNVHELWRSDGTDAGTRPVTATTWSTIANCGLSGAPGVSSLTAVPSRGLLFFYAPTGSTYGCELWTSDGTEAGTAMLVDIQPGPNPSFVTSPVDAQGILYFSALDGQTGQELWRSDGTTEGTRRIADIHPGIVGSNPSNLAAGTSGARVFFQAASNDGFPSLWVSEGDEVNTRLIRLNRRQTDTSKPAWLSEWQGTLYFSATTGPLGAEPWRTDGTSEGTRMVRDISPGVFGSAPYLFVKAGGQLFFRANDNTAGSELWRTDGTPEGTRMVKDIRAGRSDSSPNRMLAVGDTVYFGANDGTHGLELWKSDGTPEGTQMVKDIRPGVGDSLALVPEVVELGGSLYFMADDGIHGAGLWRTDGTEEGTRLVRDINVNHTYTIPTQLTRAGGLVYFIAWDATHGFELWRSDGTEEGTRLVADLTPGDRSSPLSGLTEWKGALYFTNKNGAELWRTDGTAAGTVRLMDAAQPLPVFETPVGMVGVGRWLYFTASDATHGTELWRTDGTVEGTRRVRDIAPGTTSSRPRNLVAAGGRLYFVASDGVHGQEVWVTDGSEASTEMVAEVAPGVWSSSPANLTAAGGRLYFTADDGIQGVELWSVPLSAPSDTTPPTVTCPASVIAEATSAAGAAVDYPPATAVDDITVEPTLSYSHARGSTFPLGTTQVLVTALDEVGNAATCTFDVTVGDTTPPALTCPADIVAEAVTAGSVHVSYPPATVSDAVTPESQLTVFFSPLSGNRFFLGTTPVFASVTDTAGNRAECTFTVTVVPKTLAIACDVPPATEATSPQGAIVYLSPEIVRRTDGSFPAPLTVTFNPASNTRFPKGFTPVTAHARDSQGAEGTCTFNAQVRDTTPPWITCAPFMEFEATSSAGAVADVPVPTWQDVASTSVTFNYSPALGSTFPLGATPRQATATDEAGNVSNICTTFVIVKDSTPPAVTCGPDVAVEATSPNGAAVTYTAPTATDAVTASPTLSFSHASGSVFPLGVTPVTVTARDGAGNTGTCTFRVTVSEPPPPLVITCPTDVVAEATGPNGATVTFPAATASGGRAPVAVTSSHEPGTGFALGTTSVTATARDSDERTESCSFTVTVRDTTPPSLICPADITAQVVTAGSADVFYPPATVSDAVTPASALTVSFSPMSGHRFSLGTSTVWASVTDTAGNRAECTFTVTVVRRQLTLSCAGPTVEATSPQGAIALYGPANVRNTDGTPYQPTDIQFTPPSGSLFPKGTTTVTAVVDDVVAAGTCTFEVTVRDTTPPWITCEPGIEVEATSGAGAIVDVPEPTWEDVASTSVTFNYSPAPGSTFPLGGTPRLATATDEAGNVSNLCGTVVVVKDSTPPAVTCGPDVVVETTNPNGAAVTYAPPTATDAVTASPTLSSSHASGSVFPRGVTPVTVTARDSAGNTGTCTFRVTVSEPPPAPSITCPLDVVAEAAGPEGATVTFPAATASGGRTPVALTSSHEPGSGFALGTTSVTATVRDADGRTASCAFNVTVSDTTPPEVGCSANLTAEAEDGSGAPVVFSSAVAQDAVTPLPTVTTSHAPGSLFPLGTTEVVTTATDDAGNVSSCTFTVTVSDTTAPLITCPPDVSTTTSSPDGKVVHFPAPTAGDPVSTPVLTLSHESGSRFPRGTTSVVATATDAGGNSATCTFQVTVTRRNPVTAEEVEDDQGFGCAAGSGTPLGLGWSGLLLLGCLARRRGARRG